MFRIVNPGEGLAEFPYGTGRPEMPEPRRAYDALELRGTRRLSGAWSLSGSYVWSRLSGNYSGLADSDEDGRVSPNIGGGFDELYALLDRTGGAVYGRLATDRPDVLKLQDTYGCPGARRWVSTYLREAAHRCSVRCLSSMGARRTTWAARATAERQRSRTPTFGWLTHSDLEEVDALLST